MCSKHFIALRFVQYKNTLITILVIDSNTAMVVLYDCAVERGLKFREYSRNQTVPWSCVP